MKWTEEERRNAAQTLRKIQATYAEGQYVPHDVYEELVKCHKKITTEVVFFDVAGGIYLPRRPSREEVPAEPYPSLLHSPGVTHMPNERTEDAWLRLKRSEIGEDVPLDGPYFISDFENDSLLGLYFSRLHIARFKEEGNRDPHSGYYGVGEIPWDELVPHHRDILIPIAIAHAKARGWIA